MSDAVERLQRELQAAQHTVAELQARLENREAGYRLTTLELEENRSALLFMLEDLEAGRKKIEQAHQEWMAALDAVGDSIFLHDAQFRILRCNKAYQQRAGIPFKQIIGQPYYEIFPKAGGPLPCCLRAMDKTEEAEGEQMEVGDAIYRLRASSIHDEQGSYLYSVHTLEDITGSKQAEQALRDSEATYRSLFENSLNGIAHCRMIFQDGVPADIEYITVNPRFEKVTGLKGVEGRKISEVIPGYCQDNPESIEVFGRVAKTGEPAHWEHYLAALDRWFSFSIYSPIQGEIVIVSDNITERKQAEISLNHANRALATLSAVNRSLVRASHEDELLQAICRSIVEQRGYRMASVGYVQHDESKSIKIMAHAGHDKGYLDVMQLTWAENEYGMGTSGRAIRSGTTQICQDMVNDPCCLPWRDAARQHGYASCIALPLLNADNTVSGVLNVYAEEAFAFTANEIDLLEEMAGDLAFGVLALHTREERDLALNQSQQHLMQLRESLEDTVRAIASIVEMRDPYTAGHQARVADLAVAIAGQMGLPGEQVHGIHLAGIVHDLGKIQVPAEILSKPGRLSGIEYSLIKTHAQAGYDILKDIDFPWPIAEMVRQHHERLDGSGYPQGLKGDAILLETRILSVADVVESMSAHRPYRPGLGIEAAMEEITRNSGVFYDPQVVNACLALFRERQYRFV